MADEILLEQILVETEGERVGQINALSVIEFPCHPRAFGEPHISCVVHVGDGEFTDIERKAELGGNIHAKGMDDHAGIFDVWSCSLSSKSPSPPPLTFEQSYSEVMATRLYGGVSRPGSAPWQTCRSTRTSRSPVRSISSVVLSLLTV